MGEMDAESIAFMLSQSRDGFYSNKELAPIREYSTNAFDSHVEAGCPDRPIEITLPSQLSPELRIRDFGKGLDINSLENTYFKYWKSTKRNTNDQTGFLGIGAKSAMAYSDIYTVVSICNGFKTIVTGQRDGFADVIYHQANTHNEPDGIEVIIPIQQKDIQKFIHEAMEFFKYWDVRPIFHNIDEERLKESFSLMDTKPFLCGENWAVRPAGYEHATAKAVMSKIPYPIDWGQVRNSLPRELSAKISGIFDFLQDNLTTLYFNNGTLSFTPNRESLQYNDATIKAISEKLTAIFNSLLTLITDKIKDAPNLWEAKIRYNRIFRKELDAFDKEDIYGGNLNALERLLSGSIEWNGIVIENGLFEDLDHWDKNDGKTDDNYGENFAGVLTIYVRDGNDGNIKACRSSRRRYSGANNKIVASPRSAVIVQDTDQNYLAKGMAKWFLAKKANIHQVYVLDLSKQSVRDEFINYYNFETVPVSYISQNINFIKSFLKSVRAPRQSSGAERQPLYCPYVEIKDRPYSSSVGWGSADVNARGVEGGVYVIYTKNTFTYNRREVEHDTSGMFWKSIHNLCKIVGVELTKVFGIHPRTADSVWFKESVEDGEWTSLDDWVAENIDKLPKEALKKLNAYQSSVGGRVGSVVSSLLQPKVANANGTAAKYFDMVAEVVSVWSLRGIPINLNLNWNGEQADVDLFNQMNAEMRNKYPMLYRIDTYHLDSMGKPNEVAHSFSSEVVKDAADYINMVDSLTPPTA